MRRALRSQERSVRDEEPARRTRRRTPDQAPAPPARAARRQLGGTIETTARSLLASLILPASTRADSWPTKPIRLIVPLAPGATADIVARIFADELLEGAGPDHRGRQQDRRRRHDRDCRGSPRGAGRLHDRAGLAGYTGLQHRTLQEPGLRSAEELHDADLKAAGVSNVLIVHPKQSRKRADVLAQARAKPGEYTYSSGGVGTSHHMSGVLLELRTGVKLQSTCPIAPRPPASWPWSTARCRWACSTRPQCSARSGPAA